MPDTNSLLYYAIEAHRKGDLASAEHMYRSALLQEPANIDALNLLAVLLSEKEEHSEALDLISQALELNPSHEKLLFNAATVYNAAGDTDKTITLLYMAKEKQPGNRDLFSFLGSLLIQSGRPSEAQRVYHQMKDYFGPTPDIFKGIGTAEYNLGHYDYAEENFKRALQGDQSDIQSWLFCGMAMSRQAKCINALHYLMHVDSVQPNSHDVQMEIASILLNLGLAEEAENVLQKIVANDPAKSNAHSFLLVTMHYISKNGPIDFLHEHRTWYNNRNCYAGPKNTASGIAFPRGEKIRIGYVSGDFRTHSVSYFIDSVLQNHDTDAFEIFCYSNTSRPDETTARFQGYNVHWRDIVSLSDDTVRGMIERDNITILVDLAGHTGDNRLGLFYKRSAPIQITWLGYFNTTGISDMDFRITDKTSDPEGADAFYVEQLIRMPHCFLCYTPPFDYPAITKTPFSENKFITFGSFNNPAKLTSSVIALWSALLNNMPRARLLLKGRGYSDPRVQEDFRQRFVDRGCDGDRIRFRPRMHNISDHFDTYNAIDIALDTFPFNGATTTCEALLMGVPLITLKGSMHVGRVATSILENVSLPYGISENENEYITKAVDLAHAIENGADTKQENRNRFLQSPLCDSRSFTGDLEKQFLQCMQSRK